MRIAIDARAASHPQPGGFKTYTENLLRHLPDVMSGDDEILCYFDRPYSIGREQARVLPVHFPLLGVVLREQWSIPAQACRDGVDLLHFPCSTAARFSRVPMVVTIHDAIGLSGPPPSMKAFLLPEKVKRLGMWLYSRWATRWAATNAACIVTVSQFSAREIAKTLGISSDKIKVIYSGVAEHFHPLPDGEARQAVQVRFGINHYILALGSAAPRKNIIALLQAYASLPTPLRERYSLVIVWTHGALTNQMAQVMDKLLISQQVRSLYRVLDQDLVSLYNGADLFVFPSLSEGFGLPPLEAMACGTPVIAANATSLPEVLGGAAYLVPPTDVQALSQAMVNVLTDTGLWLSLREKGLERSSMFSWERTARETLAVYRQTICSLKGDRLLG